MRPRLPLAAGVAAARAAGRLSRLAGAAAARPCPASCWNVSIPARSGASRAAAARVGDRLGDERQDDDGRDGRRDPRRRGAAGAQPRRGEPRLRRRLRAARRASGAELGLFEVDEAALPDVAAACPAARGLSRQPLPRPARPLRRARARRRALARGGRATSTRDADARPQRRRPAGRRPRARARRRRPSSASTTRARRAPELQHAADSKYCLRCGRPTTTRPPTSATSATTAARPAATHGRRSTSPRARSSSTGSKAVSFDLVDAARARARVRLAAARPLQRLQRARGRGARRARSAPRCDEIVAGLERFSAAFGRFERIAVGDRSAAPAPDQEPGRRERGPPDARRPAAPPRLAVIALNDAIADGRDVSWIWDADFEPLLERARARSSRPASARPSWRCAKYARLRPRARSRSCPTSTQALDRGLELTPRGRRARRPAHLHGDARAPRGSSRERGLRARRTGSAAA